MIKYLGGDIITDESGWHLQEHSLMEVDLSEGGPTKCIAPSPF